MSASGGAPADPGDRLAWFRDARFGLFVHWGAYAAHDWEPSWPLVGGNRALPYCQDVDVATYYRGLEDFRPQPGAAREWAALARRCGMRYAVLTTKHHDGWCLFPWEGDGAYGVSTTLGGRDLVAEFVDACRAEGLRVGLYYSLSDWHHPRYPAFQDGFRPYPFIAYPRPGEDDWASYRAVLRSHLDHLLTAYGTVDVLWFDGGWERTAAEWDAADLEAFIRARQPGIVLNDRLHGVGDYTTPEQGVPATAPGRPWETCMTMAHSWGNAPGQDHLHKSPAELVRTLARVAARGGNLLLNVSPDGAGRVPAWQRERLEAVAGWVDAHGAAVLDAGPGLEPWQTDGITTRDGDRIYVIVPAVPSEVEVRALPVARVRSVRAVATGEELSWQPRVDALQSLLSTDPTGDIVVSVPVSATDPLATAIVVDVAPGG